MCGHVRVCTLHGCGTRLMETVGSDVSIVAVAGRTAEEHTGTRRAMHLDPSRFFVSCQAERIIVEPIPTPQK